MTIGVVGDLHLKENLGYADYIPDKRGAEKKEIFDFIHDNLNDCDTIVLIGDSLNGRNNPSNVLKEFVSFVKRFGNKDIYILAGNHEKFGDGRSAIDFMKEMKIPNWHIITNSVETITTEHGNLVFCPYFNKSEINIIENQEASEKLLELVCGNMPSLDDGILGWIGRDNQTVADEQQAATLTEEDLSSFYQETMNNNNNAEALTTLSSDVKQNNILFVHHAISGTIVTANTTTDLFNEPVLSKNKLLEKFDKVVGGHIHKPSDEGRVIVTGSVFNNEVGEYGKKIWKIDNETGEHESIDLPGRHIYKITDPTMPELEALKKKSIIKVVLTKKISDGTDVLKSFLRDTFDAFILLEQYPNERKKIHFEEGMLEFTPENLLKTYAKERNVPLDKLEAAYELIKN